MDFIIYGQIGFYALEIKSSKNIDQQDLKGLKEFKKDYPESICILLYGGSLRRVKSDILCIPITDFLLSLRPNHLFT